MTVDEALHTLEATLDPWASKNGMRKARASATYHETNATAEYAGGGVLVQFSWDRNDPIVFTSLYRTTEPGPEKEEERAKWMFNLPQATLEQTRRGLARLKTFFEWRVTTPEKLVARVNAQTAELSPILPRLMAGDWSGIKLRSWPEALRKMKVHRP